jgi:hypothetical protein
MSDYPTLHLDTNSSKGTTCSKKGHECRWAWDYSTLHLNTNYRTGTHYSKKGYERK